MNAAGVNQGTSGNIGARFGDRLIVTPSATPYAEMTPDSLASTPLDGDPDWAGPLPPSTEWRFHRDILRARPEIGAVVHAHPPYCTALAMTRQGIPAAHYMIAAFGGSDVRCAGYATFGTAALSVLAVDALRDRSACLLANHGMIALGETLEKALWRANELETLARQYHLAMNAGEPVILSETDIADTLKGFSSYGLRSSSESKP
jgi:L-fuculose-phosphate aldolase